MELFGAFRMGEQMFGFADQKKDLEALEQLRRALDQAEDALSLLSVFVRNELSRASLEAVSGIVKVPADMLFQPVAAGLRQGIAAASGFSVEHGTQSSRQDRVAAAIVAECRTIFQARTGAPAPLVVRDDSIVNGPPPPFVIFARDVFSVFGIKCRVDSALRVLKAISS